MLVLKKVVKMQNFIVLCQIIIVLGIFNVWIIRYGKETNWRFMPCLRRANLTRFSVAQLLLAHEN